MDIIRFNVFYFTKIILTFDYIKLVSDNYVGKNGQKSTGYHNMSKVNITAYEI